MAPRHPGEKFGAAVLLLALASPAAPAQPQVLAQRSQTFCQLPRQVDSSAALSLLVDSAAAWERHVASAGNAPLLGRSVRWGREQVLLHALPEQATMGIRVSVQGVRAGPVLLLRVSRPGPGEMAPMALSRPCVWVVVPRVPARPWRVRVDDAAAGTPRTRLPERLTP